MSVKEIEEALKQGKLVIIRGQSEARIRISTSDPSKLKIIERK